MDKLRPYQIECLEVIENTFKSQKAQLVQLPTGSGKTRIFLEYIKRNSQKSLIIVPTTELLEQVYRNACQILGDDSVWKSGRRLSTYKGQKCLVITAACLRFNMPEELLFEIDFDLIVIDEAHHSYCPTYLEFIKDYDCYFGNWNLLGVTATPERADKKPLLELFSSLSFDRSIVDMIKNGYLCEVNAWRHKTDFKISSHEVANGDFKPSELRKLDNPSRNALIEKVYTEHLKDKKTIIFCIDIDHCESLNKLFKEKGYRSACVHGKLSHSTRSRILDDFKRGFIDVIINCQLLTEGFDEPSIEAILIARPTRSKSLYCQMIGRGLRLFPGKKSCMLHEVTDNAFKLCTFDVACGQEHDDPLDYSPGVSLTERSKQLESLDIKDVEITKERIDVFTVTENLKDVPAFEHQKQSLIKAGYEIFPDLTYMEAAFMIWELKMLRAYGIN